MDCKISPKLIKIFLTSLFFVLLIGATSIASASTVYVVGSNCQYSVLGNTITLKNVQPGQTCTVYLKVNANDLPSYIGDFPVRGINVVPDSTGKVISVSDYTNTPFYWRVSGYFLSRYSQMFGKTKISVQVTVPQRGNSLIQVYLIASDYWRTTSVLDTIITVKYEFGTQQKTQPQLPKPPVKENPACVEWSFSKETGSWQCVKQGWNPIVFLYNPKTPPETYGTICISWLYEGGHWRCLEYADSSFMSYLRRHAYAFREGYELYLIRISPTKIWKPEGNQMVEYPTSYLVTVFKSDGSVLKSPVSNYYYKNLKVVPSALDSRYAEFSIYLIKNSNYVLEVKNTDTGQVKTFTVYSGSYKYENVAGKSYKTIYLDFGKLEYPVKARPTPSPVPTPGFSTPEPLTTPEVSVPNETAGGRTYLTIITGTVTVDGSPMQGISVVVDHPVVGKLSTITDSSGKYVIKYSTQDIGKRTSITISVASHSSQFEVVEGTQNTYDFTIKGNASQQTGTAESQYVYYKEEAPSKVPVVGAPSVPAEQVPATTTKYESETFDKYLPYVLLVIVGAIAGYAAYVFWVRDRQP